MVVLTFELYTMLMESVKPEPACDVGTTLSIIGGKWKILIIYHLLENTLPMRFSALRRSLTNITEKMLTAQLRELETDGIIKREIYPVIPPRVEYQLTSLGQSLQPVLASMQQWGASLGQTSQSNQPPETPSIEESSPRRAQ